MKFCIPGYSMSKSGTALSTNSTEGLYFSSFFYIRLETFVNCFNKIFIPTRGTKDYEDMSTFSHEYIHFMQDISTVFGLSNIYNTYGRIGNYISAVFQSEATSIKFPVHIDDIQDSLLVDMAMGNLLGTDMRESWTCEKLFQNIKVVSIAYGKDDCFNMPEFKNFDNPATQYVQLRLHLTHIDGQTENKDFLFGACAIRESMANLIEQHLFPNSKDGVVVQYDIVEIICEGAKIEGCNKALMVSLCDYSLMTSNPGLYFMMILGTMKKTKYEHKSLDELYQFLDKYVRHKYDNIHDAARKRIKDMFPEKGDLLKKPGEYLLRVLDKAFTFRSENPRYWGELVENDSTDALTRFIKLANAFGCTLIIDGYNNFFSTCSTDNDLLVFPTYYAIFSVFANSGNFKCQNYNICTNLCPEKIDANCENSPWIKSTATDNEKTCAFGALWYYWKLSGKGLYLE